MLNKKVLLLSWTFSLVAVLLIAPLAGAEEPEISPVVMPVLDGETFYVLADEPIQLSWAWIATTPGLARIFIDATEDTYTLTGPDGRIVWELGADEEDAFFSQPRRYAPEFFGYSCSVPYLWATEWEYQLDPLPAGTYTLEFEANFNRPVNDGFHICNLVDSGEPAAPTPSLYPQGSHFLFTTTIEVLPNP